MKILKIVMMISFSFLSTLNSSLSAHAQQMPLELATITIVSHPIYQNHSTILKVFADRSVDELIAQSTEPLQAELYQELDQFRNEVPLTALKYIAHPEYPDFVKISHCSYQGFNTMDIIHYRNESCVDLHNGDYFQIDQLKESEAAAHDAMTARRAGQVSVAVGFPLLTLSHLGLATLHTAATVRIKALLAKHGLTKLNKAVIPTLIGADILIWLGIDGFFNEIDKRYGVNVLDKVFGPITNPLFDYIYEATDKGMNILDEQNLMAYRRGLISQTVFLTDDSQLQPIDIFNVLEELLPRKSGERVRIHVGTFIEKTSANLSGCDHCYEFKTVIDHPRLREAQPSQSSMGSMR